MQILKVSLLVATALVPTAAMAQEAPGTSAPAVGDDTTEQGSTSSSGQTTIDAALNIAGIYSDNIFATRKDEVDDLMLVTRPRITISHRDGGNSISLRGQGEFGRYDGNPSEDYNDWQIGGDGRLSLSGEATLLGGGDLRWEHESRSSPEATNGLEPTQYDRLYSYLGLLINSDPVFVRVAGTLTQYDYDDVDALGGFINNDDRDRTIVNIGLRVGHQMASGTQIFVQGAFDNREYDDLADDFGFLRGSEGISIAGGVRHQFSNQLSGEVFAGYLQQHYDDPRLTNVATVDFGAVLDWNGPTGLSATVRTDRTVEETTLPGASAYVLTSGSFTVRAMPDPRLDVGFALRGAHYDYRGAPRSEFVTGTDIWSRYWLGRNLYVGVDYTLAQRSSNAAGYDYDENRFMLSVGGQLRPHHAAGISPLHFDSAAPGGAYAAILLGHGTLVTGIDGPRDIGDNTADFGGTGASYGAAIGYGITSGVVYFGLEAEAMLDGPDWVHNADRQFSVAAQNAVGLAARLGLVTGNADLLYVRMGVSLADMRTRYDFGASTYDHSDRRTGLGFGLGMDASAGKHAFVRAEYVMSSYGDYDVPTGGGEFDNFSSSQSMFRFGGGVRFGGSGREQAEAVQADFSGPYVGFQVGHGSLTSDNIGLRDEGTMAIDVPRSSHGPLLGVVAGFGAVIHGAYVGLEAAADISNIDWNIERDQAGRIYSAEHEYSYGANARVGHVLGSTSLLFAQVGVVRTRFDIPFSTALTSVRSQETLTGLRFGIGLETALGKNTRLRLDYTATQYQKYDVQYDLSTDSFDHAETQFRIGLMWRL